MLRTTLAGLRANTRRMVASTLAVVLGVGFIAGTLIFSDTAKAAMFDQYARVAKDVDVSVQPPAAKDDDSATEALPPSTLQRLRTVPGVAAVAGRMREPLPLLDRNGRVVSNFGEPGVAISNGDDDRLRGYDVTAGRAPAAPGEAALDTATAELTGQAVGDTISVLDTARHRRSLRLVGLIDFGAAKQYAGLSVVLLTPAELTEVTGARGYRAIVATAADGVTPTRLADAVRAAVPAGTRVLTGEQQRYELANDAMTEVDGFLLVLRIFAGIALVVCAFVIYNTFNILLAQRVRQLALLRCVGGSRGQLLGSMLIEAVAIGLGGALLGLCLGFGVAYGMFSGSALLGGALNGGVVPRHSLVLTAVPVLVALLVGVLVTVLSALLPAVRASRVPPIAALRAASGGGTAGGIRGRVASTVLAALTLAAGLLLTVLGMRASDVNAATIAVVAGGVAAFLGVVLFSPLFVGPLSTALGWLPGRLFGVPARLATANTRRNPSRAAATTAALMIGIGLMAGGVVVTDTVRATATAQLNTAYPIDYLLEPALVDSDGPAIPADAAARLRADPAFAVVSRVRLARATNDGRDTQLGAVDPATLGSTITFPMSAGSLADLGPGKVVLFDGAPENKGRELGDRVTVARGQRHAELTVVGLARGTANTGNTLVAWDDFATLRPGDGDDLLLVKAADGVSAARSRAALGADLADYPTVRFSSVAEWREEITSTLDQLVTAIAALLAFAILIALIGIANTLSLSVFERTRESALTRALGLTRGQLRATLLIEAVLMAVLGALVGITFGVTYGWLTARALFPTADPRLSVPYGQLAVLLAIAALAAALAAVLPAWRAARASIVAAMAET